MTALKEPLSAEEKILARVLDNKRARSARLEKGKEMRVYWRWSGKALDIPLSVLVGLGLGMLLERFFPAIKPWGLWGGLFFGVATAIRVLYRMAVVYRRENPDDVEDES